MKALIADDLYTNRIQIGIVLQSIGIAAEYAVNGSEAIHMLQQNDYAFILMDIEMPVKNGLETTRYIRDQFKERKKREVVIIAITAHDPADFEKDFADYGFDGFISKPITPEKIKFMIEGKENLDK